MIDSYLLIAYWGIKLSVKEKEKTPLTKQLEPEPPNKTAARTAAMEQGGPGWHALCHPGRSLVLSRERESTTNTKDKLQ